MTNPKPNYKDFGMSDQMGPKLRSLVEKQLMEDLKFYGIDKIDLRFDWSESCVEGHCFDHLDGTLENFSGIGLFDSKDNLIAGGWMDFILEGDFFLAYWEFVTTYDNGKVLKEKRSVGIPEHVWQQIPNEYKHLLEVIRIQSTPNIP